MLFAIINLLAEHRPKQHAINTAIHTAMLSHISNSKLLELFGAFVAGSVTIAFIMSRASHERGQLSHIVVEHPLKDGTPEENFREKEPVTDIVENKPTVEGHKSTVFYDCLRGPGIFLKRIKGERMNVITLKLNDTFELCMAQEGTNRSPSSIVHRRYHLSTLLAAFKCDGGLISGSRVVLQFPNKVLCVDAETSDKADFVIDGLLDLKEELTGRTLAFVHALKRSSSGRSRTANAMAVEDNNSGAKSSRLHRLIQQFRMTMKRRPSRKEIKVVEPQPRTYAHDDLSWD